MDDSKTEKYVGDLITEDGKNDANIASRKSKAFGIAGDILAILEEVPLGPYRTEAGLCMRNAMFLNAILTNSEVWYGIKPSHITELEKVDENIYYEKILNAHSKTPKEMLYLEKGTVPIEFILKSRRQSYLHHILTREKSELISKIYYAQKRRPVKDDWAKTTSEDLNDLKINLSDEEIRSMSKLNFKKLLKKKIYQAAFNYLESIKETHSKVMTIKYEQFKSQPYLNSYKFKTVEKQLLFKLRTRMTNVKLNFKSMHENKDCNLCGEGIPQTDNHLLDCAMLK